MSATERAGVAPSPKETVFGSIVPQDTPLDESVPQLVDKILGLLKADDGPPEYESQATQLVKIGLLAALWHSSGGEAFATVTVGNHKENLPIRAKAFGQYLARRFYEVEGGCAPGTQAIKDSLNVLEAEALFRGREHEVYVRVAGSGDSIYLDIGDPAWKAVEISPRGWRVVSDPPVHFRRSPGMLPLPEPEAGGSLDLLRPYVNTPEEHSWALVVSWLVAALRPVGPYPVLFVLGEQGSAKTFTARVLRALIDPNIAALRGIPRDERDLMIAAKNGWVMAYDNVSGLPVWLSDAICRLATGGGSATRRLYSDNEEDIIDAKRPIVVNGINLAARDDLRDRSIILVLPPITEEDRGEEEKLWTGFQAERPRILGALVDAVAAALRNKPNVHLPKLPRMADFVKWVVAAEPALPWPAGVFLSAYSENRRDAVEAGLTDSLVAQAIIAMAHARKAPWSGTSSELLEALNTQAGKHGTDWGFSSGREKRSWPKSPQALSNKLRRNASALRSVGILVKFDRQAHTRTILIEQGSGHDDGR